MYKELITRLSADNTWVSPQEPCSEEMLKKAQAYVGFPFPEELNALLREMDGDNWCVLSAEGIMERVKLNREVFLPLFLSDFSQEAYEERVDRFIFFATNGCGDYYCYRVEENGIADPNAIYIWEHEDLGEECCWKQVAASMEEFLTRYYQSEI